MLIILSRCNFKLPTCIGKFLRFFEQFFRIWKVFLGTLEEGERVGKRIPDVVIVSLCYRVLHVRFRPDPLLNPWPLSASGLHRNQTALSRQSSESRQFPESFEISLCFSVWIRFCSGEPSSSCKNSRLNSLQILQRFAETWHGTAKLVQFRR